MLERGWREGPESLTLQHAGAGRCSKTPSQRDAVEQVPFPVPWFPLQKNPGWSPQFLSSRMTSHVLLLYVRGISNTRGLYARGRNIPCCSRNHWWPASSRHDLSHSHGRHPLPMSLCHLSMFPSGDAAWIEQGRGLILLSLQEFNWKGIAFDLISSFVSTQA